MAFSKTLKDRRLVIQCDVCFRVIGLDPFIRCAECVWDQCLRCFRLNVETAVHRKTHSYRLVSNLTDSLFCDGWRLIDELLMLNGLISFGIGNFEDISSVISTKSQKEVQDHFFFLVGLQNNERGETSFIAVPKSEPHDTEVLSYMPRRGDFESELFNDYEQIIGSLGFSGGDAPYETALKEYMLGAYATVLLRRRMWKTYVLDRHLIQVGRIKKWEVGSKATALVNRYKWLLQYLSRNDFNFFVSHLISETQLRESLYSCRKHDSLISKPRLDDMSRILGPTEHELCRRLNMPLSTYGKIKAFVIDRFMARQPLRRALEALFDASEGERIEILYNWFKTQGVVCRDVGFEE